MFPELELTPWVVAPDDRERLIAFLHSLNLSPYGPEQERFLAAAIDVARALPKDLLVELLRFRQEGNDDGAFLIRNVPFDANRIGPTPRHWSDLEGRQSFQTETFIAAIGSILGDVFAMSSSQQGRLIQNIVPVREHRNKQKATGWGTFLEWHSEDAFSEYRADFVILMCLRGDPTAATAISSFRRVHISEAAHTLLRQERFTIASGYDDDVTGRTTAKNIAILMGHATDPFVRFDPIYTKTAEGDTDARAALTELFDAVPSVARQLILSAGDLLIIDNARAAHARTNFTARLDGTDRWLQRGLVSRHLHKSWKATTFQDRIVRV